MWKYCIMAWRRWRWKLPISSAQLVLAAAQMLKKGELGCCVSHFKSQEQGAWKNELNKSTFPQALTSFKIYSKKNAESRFLSAQHTDHCSIHLMLTCVNLTFTAFRTFTMKSTALTDCTRVWYVMCFRPLFLIWCWAWASSAFTAQSLRKQMSSRASHVRVFAGQGLYYNFNHTFTTWQLHLSSYKFTDENTVVCWWVNRELPSWCCCCKPCHFCRSHFLSFKVTFLRHRTQR